MSGAVYFDPLVILKGGATTYIGGSGEEGLAPLGKFVIFKGMKSDLRPLSTECALQSIVRNC